MVTKAGTKLLDFGLAKLRDPKTAGLSVSQRPTQSASLTGEGKILGTLQYMAPEQLEGKEADHRTGHLRVWSRPLRDGDGPESIRGEKPGKPHRSHPSHRPTPALEPPTDVATSTGWDRPDVPRQRPR